MSNQTVLNGRKQINSYTEDSKRNYSQAPLPRDSSSDDEFDESVPIKRKIILEEVKNDKEKINIYPVEKDNKKEFGLIKIFLCILVVVFIFFIIQSAYLQTYTYELILGASLLLVAFSKIILSYRLPLLYIVIFTLLLGISSWLLSQNDDDYAWWGSLLLIITLVLDIGYILYFKFSKKIEFTNLSLYTTLIGGLISIGFLFITFI